MNSPRRLLALGLARACLAGPRDRDGLLARASYVLGDTVPTWLPALVGELLPLPQPTWDGLGVRTLADRLEQHPAFADQPEGGPLPTVRRWILRGTRMHRAPLGLDHLPLPCIDDLAALAAWLGIRGDDLDWLCAGAQRRRHAPLHQQHYLFSIRPKATGGARLLEAPKSRLKAAQSRLLDDLLSRVPVHEACHGFVRGRSLRGHAEAHVGQPVVVHFDLRNFFSSVTAAQVRAVFETLGYAPGVARELATLATLLTPEPIVQRMRDAGWLDWHQAKCLRSPHLPQGAPSSPMLANLCAFQLDLRLDGLATTMQARYTRYADDLVFSGPASIAASFQRLRAWVGKIALEEGYAINHRKTRLTTQAAAQTVCGIVVNARTNMRRSEFDRLRATLHHCTQGRFTPSIGMSIDAWRNHLLGRVQWADQLNPDKARRLHALWERIDWPSDTPASATE